MRRLLPLILAVALAAPARPEPPPAQGTGIALNFQNTDIEMVLRFLGEATGLVFIKSEAVRGFVTVAAPGRVSAPEALEILQAALEVRGFTLVRGAGKLIKVLTQAEAIQTPLDVRTAKDPVDVPSDGNHMITQVVLLKFVGAADLKTEISPLLSRGGSLISDERMNALVITDMAANIARLLKIIQALDVRSPQVLIEALIVEVSLTRETKLGIEWSHLGGFTASDHGFTASAGQAFGVPGFITEGLTYAILRDDARIKGLIQALATDKNVNILSTPHILTVNNQPAIIRVGEEVPVLTQTRNIQGGETIRSFDFKPVAIELEVTPRINHERDVFLKVHPLVKKILGFNAELNAPILANREAKTSVIVKDGHTVVIGGLMKDDRSVAASKIPILGDIPLIGALFRKSGVTREKTELLVFITPHVIETDREARETTLRKEAESRSARTPYKMDARERIRLGRHLYRGGRRGEAIEQWEAARDNAPDEATRRKAESLIRRARKKRG